MLFTFWAVATKLLVVPRVWLVWTLSILGVIMCLSVALVTGSAFKLIVSTCGPESKGALVGAAKGYSGLGAGAYAMLFGALGRDNDLDVLLMIGCFNLLAAALPALLLLPSNSNEEPRVDDLSAPHFRTIYSGLAGLGSLVVGQSLVSLYHGDVEKEGPDYVHFFLLCAVWMGPVLSLLIHPRLVSSAMIPSVDEEHALLVDGQPSIGVVKPSSIGVVKPFSIAPAPPTGGSAQSIVSDYQEVTKKTDEPPTEEPSSLTPAKPRQYKLLEMLSTVEAWLLCWTCTILTGGGTVMTNNMGQMSESLRLHENVTPAALALFCAAQALSRVITGVLSDHCLQTYDWARPIFLLVASLAGAIAHIVLAFATHEIPFVIGVALSGVAFGMVWPLVVLIVEELFGAKHLGANYMFFDGFDIAIGTLIVSKFIAGEVYDRHVVHDGHQEDETTCYGEGCFQMTHVIVAALSGSCVFTCLCLLNTKLSKVAYDGVPSSVTKRH